MHLFAYVKIKLNFSCFYLVFISIVSTSPNPQAGGPPLVCCPLLLIQYIRSYPPYWRPFLNSKPEEVPCRGDRDRLITDHHHL